MATRGRRAMNGTYQVRGRDAGDFGLEVWIEFRIGTNNWGQFRLSPHLSQGLACPITSARSGYCVTLTPETKHHRVLTLNDLRVC